MQAQPPVSYTKQLTPKQRHDIRKAQRELLKSQQSTSEISIRFQSVVTEASKDCGGQINENLVCVVTLAQPAPVQAAPASQQQPVEKPKFATPSATHLDTQKP